MGLHNIGTTGLMAQRAPSILTKDDLDCWRSRAQHPVRFLFLSVLIGGLAFALLFIAIGLVQALQRDSTDFWTAAKFAVLMAIFGLFGCGGVMILPICGVLLSGGLKEYRRVIIRLEEHRVCDVCECVALYGGSFVNPTNTFSTRADLSPTMTIVNEAEESHTLCPNCIDEITD